MDTTVNIMPGAPRATADSKPARNDKSGGGSAFDDLIPAHENRAETSPSTESEPVSVNGELPPNETGVVAEAPDTENPVEAIVVENPDPGLIQAKPEQGAIPANPILPETVRNPDEANEIRPKITVELPVKPTLPEAARKMIQPGVKAPEIIADLEADTAVPVKTAPQPGKTTPETITTTEQTAAQGLLAARSLVENPAGKKIALPNKSAAISIMENFARNQAGHQPENTIAMMQRPNAAQKIAPPISIAENLDVSATKPGNSQAVSFEQALGVTSERALTSNSPVTIIKAGQSALPLNSIALDVAKRFDAGVHKFRIQIDPPEMGRIDVRLNITRNGQVTAQMIVDRPETLAALNRDAQALERALNATGLDTEKGGLNFSLRDDGQAANHDENKQHKFTSANPGAELADSMPPANETLLRGYISPAGLDIRV